MVSWSHDEETRELPGERHNARNNARCMQARKTTHGLDGRHQDVDTVKARKLAYYGHTMRKQGSCPEKDIMQGTIPGTRRRRRPRTAWMDNIKT